MKVLFVPVVFLLPERNPIKVLVLEILFLISLFIFPELLVNVTLALEAEITLIDKTIVPLKSVVGTISRVAVDVALGPTAPVAVKELKVMPP